MKSSLKAYIYAGLATVFWSTAASAFKLTLRLLGNDYIIMLFLSTLISVMVLLVLLIGQKKVRFIFRLSREEFLSSALLGLFNPFIYYIVLFKAYTLLPGQEAQPLNFTWPIILTLLSIPLLKQKIRSRHIVALVTSFTGVLIIATQGDLFAFHFTNLLGALLALGSSFVWALYWIFNLRDKRDSIEKLLLNFCFGLFYISVVFIVSGHSLEPSWEVLGGVAWIGCFEMGVTFLLWLKALENAGKTSTVANLVYLCPFLALLFLRVVVGEHILLSSVIGLCLIVSGILIQSDRNKAQAN